ncbi:MAG: PAS domain S-box protein [Terriglobia bacterium]
MMPSEGNTPLSAPAIARPNPSSLSAGESVPNFAAHAVQFYASSNSLLDSVGDFIASALSAGDAAVVIAREAHRHGLEQQLLARGLDLAAIEESGRLVFADARQALSAFMSEGQASPERFEERIGGLIKAARTKGGTDHRQVAVFGEMVALLFEEDQRDAAIQVEKLWNTLGRKNPLHLRCAYRLSSFSRKEDLGPFLAVCAEHSHVIPGEQYPLLASADEQLRNVARLQQRAQALDHQAALADSEARFQLLVESVRDYAIFMLDTRGNVVSWNLGAERIKGYTASEIKGRHFSVFYPPEDVASGKPDRLLRLAAAEERCEDEGWRIRKDGTRFWACVVITAMRDEVGNLTGFSKVTRDLTERRQQEEALRKVTAQVLSLQDEERRRLARELHDSTAQTLTALAINLRLLEQHRATGNYDASAELLKESMSLADEAGREIRNLSHLLHPPDLDDLGLVRALRWFAQRFSERSGIRVDLDLSEKGSLRLPREVEVALFRIAQEALANVQRHSGSSTASVRLNIRRSEVVMKIQDRGRGIPAAVLEPDRDDAHTGVGLAGMRERVRQLKGQFSIDRGARGTAITVAIPLPALGVLSPPQRHAESAQLRSAARLTSGGRSPAPAGQP